MHLGRECSDTELHGAGRCKRGLDSQQLEADRETRFHLLLSLNRCYVTKTACVLYVRT